MAADLHIHVMEGVTEEELAMFFESTLGSPFFKLQQTPWEERKETFETISNTPKIWIGEVSWLKAALFENGEETYIPAPVEKVSELIGWEFPVLDEELKQKLLEALEIPNQVNFYTVERDKKELDTFLSQHMGKRLFTVSW